MADETRVQVKEVRKGMEAAGSILERYMIRLLGPLGRRIEAASRTGRIMALIGVVVAIVGLVLIFMNSLYFSSVVRRGLRVVNITYQMEGYGIVLLAGIALFVVGILQKGRGR